MSGLSEQKEFQQGTGDAKMKIESKLVARSFGKRPTLSFQT
jgi:hypothetical protein